MTGRTREELNDRFLAAVELLLAYVHSTLIREWQKHDLTILQARTLDTLMDHGPMRMTTLAERMQHNLSAATSVIDRLVEKGLVQRSADPNDRRAVVCGLTELGAATARQISGATEQVLTAIMRNAETDDMESMALGLEELLRQVQSRK